MLFIAAEVNFVFIIFLIEFVKVKAVLFRYRFSLKLFFEGLSFLMGFKIFHLPF